MGLEGKIYATADGKSKLEVLGLNKPSGDKPQGIMTRFTAPDTRSSGIVIYGEVFSANAQQPRVLMQLTNEAQADNPHNPTGRGMYEFILGIGLQIDGQGVPATFTLHRSSVADGDKNHEYLTAGAAQDFLLQN